MIQPSYSKIDSLYNLRISHRFEYLPPISIPLPDQPPYYIETGYIYEVDNWIRYVFQTYKEEEVDREEYSKLLVTAETEEEFEIVRKHPMHNVNIKSFLV